MEFLSKELIYGNTIINFLSLIGFLVLTFLVSFIVQKLFRNYLKKLAEKTETLLDDILLETFEQPIYYFVLAFGFSYAFNALVLPESGHIFIENVTTVVMVVLVAYSANKFVEALRKVFIDPITAKTKTKIDDQIVPIIQNGIKGAIWIFAAMIIFSNLGYDMISLLTGLGLAGLAFAMAAKDTLSNVFGSLTIFADRPFQLGDNVEINGRFGNVEDVGMRTCRIRTLENTLITVPNKVLVGNLIENFSAHDARRNRFVVGLVYDTSSEDLERAMKALRDILLANDAVRNEDITVHLQSFGSSALEIMVTYWVTTVPEFFDVNNAVNLKIKRTFDRENWNMAFPSRTVYLEQAAQQKMSLGK